ncbi:MAG: ribosome-associated translation inhibitor RaiA [Acidobacteriota bacterium]|nr:ribosome-associated translation inhibitor RaiA [Acidobacteriota bacterium]
MDVRYTARRVKVTPTVRKHLKERLSKLQKYVPELDAAEVKLVSEKHRFVAEILIHARHKDRVAQDESDDLVTAIDGAATRLERQLRRLKERTKRGAPRHANGPVPRSAAQAALDEPAGPKAAGGKRTTAARAARASRAARSADTVDVVRERMPGGKPISVDEAIERLMESERPFVLFMDSRNERPCVLYKREDGRLGLVTVRR